MIQSIAVFRIDLVLHWRMEGNAIHKYQSINQSINQSKSILRIGRERDGKNNWEVNAMQTFASNHYLTNNGDFLQIINHLFSNTVFIFKVHTFDLRTVLNDLYTFSTNECSNRKRRQRIGFHPLKTSYKS